MDQTSRRCLFFVLLAAGAVVGVGAWNPQSAPVRSDLTLSGFMGVLGGLFVLVLLIERATELFVILTRETEERNLRAGLRNPTERVQPGGNTEVRLNLEKRRAGLEQYSATTKRTALAFSFVISAIVCAGGVGILNAVLDIQPETVNLNFIRGIDIFLTAALLAGGSDVFHQFVRAVESILRPQSETSIDETARR